MRKVCPSGRECHRTPSRAIDANTESAFVEKALEKAFFQILGGPGPLYDSPGLWRQQQEGVVVGTQMTLMGR